VLDISLPAPLQDMGESDQIGIDVRHRILDGVAHAGLSGEIDDSLRPVARKDLRDGRPIVQIHPEAAAKQGIREGDWVVIESPRGRVRQRARLFAGMDPRIVAAEHAWWFPEKKDPGHGWDESNINILTDNAYASCDPAMGATPVRTLLCRIYAEKKDA